MTSIASLSYDILLEIINKLPFKDILTLRYIVDDINELVYWKSLEHRKILLHDTYLIADQIQLHIETNLEPLYNFLKLHDNICIAGGYPTLQYLNKNFSDHPCSDIDVYIFGTLSCIKETLQLFLQFLDSSFSITSIQSLGISSSIFNIKLSDTPRIIQIIGTHYRSISEIIRQFDASHNRCCWYLGHSYITYDAMYAKTRQLTYFTKNHLNYTRLNKAHNLGLQIFHLPHYTITKDPIHRKPRFKNRDFNIEDMIKQFHPYSQWYNDYSLMTLHLSWCSTLFDSLFTHDIPLQTSCIDVCKHHFDDFHDRLQILLQLPNQYHYYLRELRWGEYVFNITGQLLHTFSSNYNILTNDLDTINVVQSLLLHIYYMYHHSHPTVPSSYHNHLVIDDTKHIAFINSCKSRGHSPRWLDPFINLKYMFTVKIIFRIAKSQSDFEYVGSYDEWFDGINGSYGHVYFNILKVDRCK